MVGGGTDFPEFFSAHGGAVVSAAIDKFSTIAIRRQPPYFDFRSRFVWSRIEEVDAAEGVIHPSIRACLGHMGMEQPRVNLHHDGDIPSQSGLGSSASFTVGLLKALYALEGREVSSRTLATDAIAIDRSIETCGFQDQIAAAYGGLNLIRFSGEGDFVIDRLVAPKGLEEHLMLFYTRCPRTSSDVEKAKRLVDQTDNLLAQKALVDVCLRALRDADFRLLGDTLSDSWDLKKAMSPVVSNDTLDDRYDAAMEAGAYGGKVTGAGGGGSFLFIVPPDRHGAVRHALSDCVYVPIGIEHHGARIVYHEP